MPRPYVAICVASAGAWKPHMGQCLAHLTYYSTQVCDLGVLIAEGSIVSCRNRLVLSALNADASHVLMIDADNTFPADGLAVMLSRQVDVVGAVYMRRAEPYTLLGAFGEPSPQDDPELAPAVRLPGGFMLIRSEMFGLLDPPWFQEPIAWDKRNDQNVIGLTSDDTYFCERAIERGIRLWADLRVSQLMGHIGEINVKWKPDAPKIKLAS